MPVQRFALAGALGFAGAVLATGADLPVIGGFTPEASRLQRQAEARLLAMPRPSAIEAFHRELTREPHPAGSAAAVRVADYVTARFREAGLTTETVSYDVLLSWPRRVEVAVTAPERVTLARPEPAIAEDADSAHPELSGPWHAYAAGGQVEAEAVYVNFGRPEDYDTLARLGVDVRGKVAVARYFGGYRGGKSLEAERRGVAALLVYSDPAEDGYVQGDVYPRGPWGPDGHVQRGSNVYDFIVPGDPLTPGWASVAGAQRIREDDSRILPKIPTAPLSFRDAREILERLGGPVRPAREWQGGGPFTYHAGPGPARVRVAIDVPREVRPIRNVIARIPGADPDPDVARQVVLLSNHHDAWTFGGVDPSSGTATAIELARALGELQRSGARPRRTIVIGIWDAEEFTLTGSTEWGEQHADWLARDAVACLNVDAAASGDRLSVGAVPSLRPFIYEAARAVPDPKGRGTLYDAWKAAGTGSATGGYGVVAGERSDEPPVLVLGSGSDYTVFFNHLGVPSIDVTFDGPYGVYHSAYDSHAWMRRFGDPGFEQHAAMVRLWGVMALRLANADVLPFDYGVYGRDIAAYLDDLEAVANARGVRVDLDGVRRAAQALADVGLTAGSTDVRDAGARNRALLRAERDLLTPDGIPGRPFFRHLVYAPLPSYAAQTLPGVREAVMEGDVRRAQAQADLLATALQRAVRTLRDGAAAGR